MCFTNLARETLRCELSSRDASMIATAVLIDVGIVSLKDDTLIIDKSKIEREMQKLGDNLTLRHAKNLRENKIECVFFDGREDKSLTTEKDSDINMVSSHYTKENHYSITDPNEYVGHFTLPPKAGAKGLSRELTRWIRDSHQLNKVKVLGSDSINMMTEYKGGAIHFTELELGHKVMWDICQPHTVNSNCHSER